ncbi:MAG: polysaccharide biosynthesis/export family protein, partial [Candidatus Omnitrophica bacterium]|nr:polysaccharide biosynthesis/export family protein [Candidatus Omnitrophota bacterium]
MFKFISFLLISLFLLPNAVFAQIIPGNTDSEYRIAVSDLLEISVYEEPDLTKVVRVAADGTISYPLLGN